MPDDGSVEMQVEGPEVEEETGAHHFIVRSSERDVRFTVIPETAAAGEGWAVRIEGIPAPSIVHAAPWPSVEAARDAALRAIGSILTLERVQREDRERGKPKT